MKVLKNEVQFIVEHSGKIKNVFFLEQEIFFDSAVTDQVFDIHAVNDGEGQPDTAVRLEHTLYVTPITCTLGKKFFVVSTFEVCETFFFQAE